MAKAKLPKSTKISGVKWRVVAKRNVVHEDGEVVEGQCHFEHELIEVSVKSGDEVTILMNFWHEIGHALIHETGIELTPNEAHAIIYQWEKFLAANVDWRDRPRKQPKTNPSSVATQPAAKKRRGRK